MKQLLLTALALLVLSANAHADSLLNRDLEDLVTTYRVIGDLSNHVDVISYSKPEFMQAYGNYISPIKTQAQLERTLRECVFILEGAYGYGDHISVSVQNKLVAEAIFELRHNMPGVEKFELQGANINRTLLETNCALVLMKGKRVTALEAYVID